MNFLKKSWHWTKERFDWILISANIIIISFVIFYTSQLTATTDRYEIQNLQLIKNNTILVEQNENLSGLLNKAGNIYKEQDSALQRQQEIIEMQREGIDKLIQRIKQLERLLNDDFITAS